jgi:hypothetical protein
VSEDTYTPREENGGPLPSEITTNALTGTPIRFESIAAFRAA